MKDHLIRYQRQIILKGFGEEAQEKLSKARVLVIGAGGLGCPILQYLAAAGVGRMGIADDDMVSITNLNRQLLYVPEDIGKWKAIVAAEKIKALNNQIVVDVINQRWSPSLSLQYFDEYDIIVDATDNFASRYLINDGCVLFNKPLVFGAVSQFEGQAAVFNVPKNGISLNYRDLFPIPPKNNEVLNCMEGGVLGVLPGLIGVMQATEVIKLLTGVGESLANQMLTYNALTQSFYKIQLIQNPIASTQLPESIEVYLQTNYEYLCQ